MQKPSFQTTSIKALHGRSSVAVPLERDKCKAPTLVVFVLWYVYITNAAVMLCNLLQLGIRSAERDLQKELGNLKALPVADVETEAVVLDEIDLLDDIYNRFVDCETESEIERC